MEKKLQSVEISITLYTLIEEQGGQTEFNVKIQDVHKYHS